MSYKHCCVIDSTNHYKEFVLVMVDEEENEIVQNYELLNGETLVETMPPLMKVNANSDGFITPSWNSTAWTESATETEIAEWDSEHPAPTPEVQSPSIEDRVSALENAMLENIL